MSISSQIFYSTRFTKVIKKKLKEPYWLILGKIEADHNLQSRSAYNYSYSHRFLAVTQPGLADNEQVDLKGIGDSCQVAQTVMYHYKFIQTIIIF